MAPVKAAVSKFEKLFGGPARKLEAPITRREMDLAASIQAVTEDILLRCGRHASDLTGQYDRGRLRFESVQQSTRQVGDRSETDDGKYLL